MPSVMKTFCKVINCPSHWSVTEAHHSDYQNAFKPVWLNITSISCDAKWKINHKCWIKSYDYRPMLIVNRRHTTLDDLTNSTLISIASDLTKRYAYYD